MMSPQFGALLQYNLYTDPARTEIWGDGQFGVTVPGAGNGTTQSFPVYGRVFPGQVVPSGPYSDYIQVTVLF